MSSFKGFLAIVILTSIVVWAAIQLKVGVHHSDPIWALGTATGFLILLVSDVALFFAVAGDDPFKWEK
jgi:hypothetical protein